jgi:hypothetical protein
MVQKRESALQRIQVGVVGLVIVLLFVSLANMVIDRAFVGDPSTDFGLSKATPKDSAPDEPLAELGVAPVVDPDKEAKSKQAGGVANGKN